jgi:hypothetical protein
MAGPYSVLPQTVADYSVLPRTVADYLLEHRNGTFRGWRRNLEASVPEQTADFDAVPSSATTITVGAIDVAVVPVQDALDAVGHGWLVERFREVTRT